MQITSDRRGVENPQISNGKTQKANYLSEQNGVVKEVENETEESKVWATTRSNNDKKVILKEKNNFFTSINLLILIYIR